MLEYNFSRILKARGIEHAYAFLKNVGFGDHMASDISHNRIKVFRPKEMERFCLHVGCTPNDIMEWIPENEKQVDDNHPLNLIRRNDKVVDLTRTLNSIPLGYLDTIEEVIEATLKKLRSEGESL